MYFTDQEIKLRTTNQGQMRGWVFSIHMSENRTENEELHILYTHLELHNCLSNQSNISTFHFFSSNLLFFVERLWFHVYIQSSMWCFFHKKCTCHQSKWKRTLSVLYIRGLVEWRVFYTILALMPTFMFLINVFTFYIPTYIEK